MKVDWVPSHWDVVQVGDVVEPLRRAVSVDPGTLYHEIGIRSHGKGIFYKEPISGKELGDKRVFWIEPDCFVVNIVFAWEGAVAQTTQAEAGMIASHRFPMYKPLADALDLDFMTYFFKSKRSIHLLGLASPGGAGRNKTLGQQNFLQLEIPLPPIEEQKKIAAILQTCDEAIDLTAQLIAAKQQRKQALMQQLLTGKVRFPGFETAWKNFKLEELGNTYSGLSGKTKENFGHGDKYYIPYKNIFDNSAIDLNWVELVDIKEGENQNKVKYGDIFFTISSETSDEIGMSSVLLDNLEDCFLNSFCFGFRLCSFSLLIPEYARYLLRSESI